MPVFTVRPDVFHTKNAHVLEYEALHSDWGQASHLGSLWNAGEQPGVMLIVE